MRVSYVFLDVEGHSVVGKSTQKKDYRTPSYVLKTPGSYVPTTDDAIVLFDPKQPAKNFLYPSSLVKCVAST